MDFQLAEVWEHIRQGDTQAWTQLVEEYAGMVYGVARQTGLDSADAEDCAQFAWVSLYRQRHRIRKAEAVPAWLARTVRRRAVRLSQSLRRQLPLQMDVALETAQPDDPEQILRAEQALPEALDKLDPRCRDLLLNLFLTDDHQTSYARMAAKLGVKQNTIGPMRTRCLNRLKRILIKMGVDLH